MQPGRPTVMAISAGSVFRVRRTRCSGPIARRGQETAKVIVLRPLDMGFVNRLLQELGGTDEQGRPTLDGVPVEIKNGMVACRWLIGPYCNRVAEEFALRLREEPGWVLADREHSCVIEPEQLQGLNRQLTATPEASGR
jgi:hypothetical protein